MNLNFLPNKIHSRYNGQKENYWFIFLLSMAIIAGTGYQFYVSMDYSLNIDGLDYLKMMDNDYNVSITRRYRALVPLIVNIITLPLEYATAYLWPHRSGTGWTIKLCSYLINLFTMSAAGVVLYRICREYGASVLSSLFALFAVLVSRWGLWFTATPNSDAIYLLVICLTIFGIKSEKKWPLIFAIFIGPFAKESFIFMAPLILLCGKYTIKLPIQIVYFTVSGILVFSFRFWLDKVYSVDYDASINNAFAHFENILFSFNRMANLRGIGELWGVWGFFELVILIGLSGTKLARKSWMQYIDFPIIYLIFCMIFHAIISTEVSRMLYFASPSFAVAFALIIDNHNYFEKYRNWIGGYHNIENINTNEVISR